MDSVSFYILPLQMQMSAQESPVWTLTRAKIWLATITATVFGDGPDKTVTSVSIFPLKVNSKCLSFHWRPLLLLSNASSHSLDTQHRSSLESLTLPHVVTCFFLALANWSYCSVIMTELACPVPFPGSNAWQITICTRSIWHLLGFTSYFFFRLWLNLCTSHILDCTW